MRKRKKKNNLKKVVFTFILLSLLWIFGFYLYTTYQNIEINESSYTAKKTESTTEVQTVEKVEEESKKVADIIEKACK